MASDDLAQIFLLIFGVRFFELAGKVEIIPANKA
jgi:hypothetical protein